MWLNNLKYDPIQPLLDSNNTAVVLFAQQYLLEDPQPELTETIYKLPEIQRMVKKQGEDGAWQPAKKNQQTSSGVNYALIETWKRFRFLVEQYELDRKYECVEKAADYVFSCQTGEGDFRGFLADQYAMYYTGALLALLIKAGYEDDPRVDKSFQWLLAARQDDGGWVANPLMASENISWAETRDLTSKANRTIEDWDKKKPFCINATGMVIRAFAVHSQYCQSEAAKTAANLLKQRFFTKNNYTSYQHKDNWLVFQYPYWWNNLVSALDAISLIVLDKNDEDIQEAVNWLLDHQQENGLWKNSYSNIHKNRVTSRTIEAGYWITLTICRILKRIMTLEELKRKYHD